jgi:hypothetical protein
VKLGNATRTRYQSPTGGSRIVSFGLVVDEDIRSELDQNDDLEIEPKAIFVSNLNCLAQLIMLNSKQ